MAETLSRVVYVEDEPDIQAIVRIALEAIGGLQVTIFNSGQEAIARAADQQPQLLVLDVMMPGLDGPSTLRLLREQTRLQQVPAIFMTAKAQPQEIEQLLRQGAIAVVSKPFDPMQLAEQLQRHWQQWQQQGAEIK
ncbi:response regulator [Permianibacter sp. IMCC34836]|uniref:response regulator n=1 Tax=Permianibacter fluminis TaxID=2738515 RepID=UPI0015525CB4|nr:response regulator [Permianibacter fluminis]NQD36567.1 response regulator [Permianibacter fluminis]